VAGFDAQIKNGEDVNLIAGRIAYDLREVMRRAKAFHDWKAGKTLSDPPYNMGDGGVGTSDTARIGSWEADVFLFWQIYTSAATLPAAINFERFAISGFIFGAK
jgi:hypothetical protein